MGDPCKTNREKTNIINFCWKAEKKRSFWGHKNTGEDNAKKDFKTTGGRAVEWSQVAQGRVQWSN
jgi:hypothetical protein